MTWFNNFRVLYKVLLLVSILLLVIAGMGFIGYNAANKINNKSNAQEASGNEIDLAHNLYEEAILLDSITDKILIRPNKDVIAQNEEQDKVSTKNINEYMAQLALTADETQKTDLQKISEAFKRYLPAVNNVFTVAKSMSASPSEEDMQRLNQANDAIGESGQNLKEMIKDYVANSVKENHRASSEATQEYESSSRILLFSTLAAVFFGIAAGWLIATKGVSRPLKGVLDVLNSLIRDDLSVAIDNAHRKDEVGDLAKVAQTFKDVLVKNKAMVEAEKLEIEKKAVRQKKIAELIAGFDETATQTVATVASASTQLSQTAENMSVVAGSTNQQSIEVASASEQASHNVQSVASAAEEMAATVQEISRQISMSNDIVRQAMQKAEDADNSSRELVDMSKSVGTIATLIEDIAGQINLLALNATIESARSGEAGKGFAVVANEVKNLATQTAKATEQIRQQLDAVQKTAVSVADMLGGVRASIGEVSQSSAAIAAAVEEQSAATHEIVSNMNTATQGVEQINSGIFAIKGGTDSTTAATHEVLDAAKMLSAQAEKMDAQVKSFLSNIQAA